MQENEGSVRCADDGSVANARRLFRVGVLLEPHRADAAGIGDEKLGCVRAAVARTALGLELKPSLALSGVCRPHPDEREQLAERHRHETA